MPGWDLSKEPSPLDNAQQQLGLVDLINKVKSAPVELALKEQDLALKQNDVRNIEINNTLRGLEQEKLNLQITKDRTDLFQQEMNQVLDAYNTNPEIGIARLQMSPIFAGSPIAQNKDGTHSVLLGGKIPITFYGNTIKDPEKRTNIENQLRDDFLNRNKDFEPKAAAYNAVKSNILVGQGPNDIASLINLVKLIEPGAANAVREGEVALYSGSNPIVQQLFNFGNAIKWDGTKTVFGNADSPTRKQYLKIADDIFQNNKNNVVASAQTYKGIATRSGVNYKNIVTPFAGLKDEDYFPLEKTQNAPAQVLQSSSNTGAGINQGNQQASDKPKTAPSLSDLTNEWSRNTFRKGNN